MWQFLILLTFSCSFTLVLPSIRTSCWPGLWSQYSNFRLRLQHLEKFLATAPEQFGPKTEKYCIVCVLACPTNYPVEVEPRFQAPAPPSKRFWLWLRPSKIAWAPAPQPCYWLKLFLHLYPLRRPTGRHELFRTHARIRPAVSSLGRFPISFLLHAANISGWLGDLFRLICVAFFDSVICSSNFICIFADTRFVQSLNIRTGCHALFISFCWLRISAFRINKCFCDLCITALGVHRLTLSGCGKWRFNRRILYVSTNRF